MYVNWRRVIVPELTDELLLSQSQERRDWMCHEFLMYDPDCSKIMYYQWKRFGMVCEKKKLESQNSVFSFLALNPQQKKLFFRQQSYRDIVQFVWIFQSL